MTQRKSECDPIDVCCIAALLCLSFGIIFSSLGLVIKTDYKVDGEIPARDMEKVEEYYQRLVLFLQLCDIFGISMVTTGGCLLILVVVVMAAKGELFGSLAAGQKSADSDCHDDGRKQEFPLLCRSTGSRLHSYGSNDPTPDSGAGK